MRVHVGVDLGGETEIARMKCSHDPQRVIAICRAHIRICKVRLPANGQADEFAAVESVERVYDEDVFEIVLGREFHLIDQVGFRLRFTFRAIDEIFPLGILLNQNKVAMLTYVFVKLKDAVESRFGRGGEESVGGSARVEDGVFGRRWNAPAVAGEGSEEEDGDGEEESAHLIILCVMSL